MLQTSSDIKVELETPQKFSVSELGLPMCFYSSRVGQGVIDGKQRHKMQSWSCEGSLGSPSKWQEIPKIEWLLLIFSCPKRYIPLKSDAPRQVQSWVNGKEMQNGLLGWLVSWGTGDTTTHSWNIFLVPIQN